MVGVPKVNCVIWSSIKGLGYLESGFSTLVCSPSLLRKFVSWMDVRCLSGVFMPVQEGGSLERLQLVLRLWKDKV